jgi:hypothetical protein
MGDMTNDQLLALSVNTIRFSGCEPQGFLRCPACDTPQAWCEHLEMMVCARCGDTWYPAISN